MIFDLPTAKNSHPSSKAEDHARSARQLSGELGAWELTLSSIQFVVVTGLFLGMLAVSYSLGFFQGKEVGYTSAMSSSIREQVPLMIPDSERAALFSDELAASLYAKLGDSFDDVDEPSERQLIASSRRTDSTTVSESDARDTKEPSPLLRLQDETPIRVENVLDDEVSPQAERPTRPSLGELLGRIAPTEQERTYIRELGGERPSVQPSDGAADAQRVEAKLPSSVTPPSQEEGRVVPEDQRVARAVEPRERQPQQELAREESADRQDETASETVRIPPGWYAQISAPEERSVAEELSRRLHASGFPALIEPARVRGVQYYRVLVGPEPDRTLARRLLSQVSREPFVEGSPFIKQVQ